MRGGARKGAGRKKTGLTKALGSYSISLATLRRLENTVPGGQRSSFVDQAICEALGKLMRPQPGVPKVSAPKPFETI